MMEKYHKIETLLNRDKTTFKVIEGEWRLPEFDYLKDLEWVFTEKIDGTNMRVDWHPAAEGLAPKVIYGGRTDNAQIPAFLLAALQDICSAELFQNLYPETPMVLYGEGYGAKIQKGGGNYIANGVDFAVFDVAIEHDGRYVWLERYNVVDIARNLGLTVAPVVGGGSLERAIWEVQNGQTSTFGDFRAEGLVVRPKIELRTRRGHRLIGKIKAVDFK